ncbi:MAG: hypothetical protein JW863_07530 [Chitinispirillaceae bacterium]|nr:hypothetical protein [Chitinispirillaceae bacterium]
MNYQEITSYHPSTRFLAAIRSLYEKCKLFREVNPIKKYRNYLVTGIVFTIGMVLSYPHLSLHAVRRFLPFMMLAVIIVETFSITRSKVFSSVAGMLRFPAYRGNPEYKNIFLLYFSIFISCMMLFDYWFHFSNNYYTIGGRVPFSDAMGYLYGARCLIEHGSIDVWAARRPLASCFYAVLLKFTGGNIQITMFIVSLLFAVSVYRVGKAVLESFGFSAAFLCTLFLSYFQFQLIAAPMTENVGLIFANLSCAILWKSVVRRSLKHFIAGLFIFSLALTIRSGALFAIPLMALFGGITFGKAKKTVVKVAVLCLFAGGVPFILNSIIAHAIAPEEPWMLNGNLSYTLYGLVKGDKEWQYITVEHPELFDGTLSDGEISKHIYRYAFSEFKEHPQVMFLALAKIYYRAAKTFFGICMPFGFVVSSLAFMVPWMVALLSPLIFGMKRPEMKGLLFLMVVAAGVWLSWPVLKSAGHRALAITVPFTCFMIAVGCGILITCLKSRGGCFRDTLPPVIPIGKFELRASMVLVFILLTGPFFLKMSCPKNTCRTMKSGVDSTTLFFRITRGSSIVISPDDIAADARSVPISQYLQAAKIRADEPEFSMVKPGDCLYSAVYNLADPGRPCHYLCIDQDVERFAGSIATCTVRKKGNLWFGTNVTIIEKK